MMAQPMKTTELHYLIHYLFLIFNNNGANLYNMHMQCYKNFETTIVIEAKFITKRKQLKFCFEQDPYPLLFFISNA